MSNKLIYLALFLGVLLIFASFITKNEYVIIEEGASLGAIKLHSSKIKDADALYGKGKTARYKKVIEQKKGYSKRKWIMVHYDQANIEVKATKPGETIAEISIAVPFKAKTSKGIILGQSTTQDVLRSYGKPEEKKNVLKFSTHQKDHTISASACCDSVYSYSNSGIDFYIDCDTTFIEKEGKTIERTTNPKCGIVKKIVIYSPGTSSHQH